MLDHRTMLPDRRRGGIAGLANGFANSSYGQLRTPLDYAAVRDPPEQAQLTAMD
jgi:hypothetical protein